MPITENVKENIMTIDLPHSMKNYTGIDRMNFIYNSELFAKYFADGWKILCIFHGQNKVTLYKP